MPKAGETVLAAPRLSGPGGKGLNQAVAAARAGASTRFIGAVGADPEGAELLAVLATEGIEALVRTTSGRTGLAVVMVDASGENVIVVDPGANAELVGVWPSELAAITAADVLLMQLEIPLPTVAEAAGVARAAGTTVVLNAAPQAPLDERLCGSIDLLLVNEGEARSLAADALAGRPANGARGPAPLPVKELDEYTKLLARCYLKQGEWQVALQKGDWQHDHVHYDWPGGGACRESRAAPPHSRRAPGCGPEARDKGPLARR